MSEGAVVIAENSDPDKDWIEIEDGIEIQFQPSGQYRTGDYWLIPARVATGHIEWPVDSTGSAAAILPHGIEHHYAPLAVIPGTGGNIPDCRCPIKPAAICPDSRQSTKPVELGPKPKPTGPYK